MLASGSPPTLYEYYKQDLRDQLAIAHTGPVMRWVELQRQDVPAWLQAAHYRRGRKVVSGSSRTVFVFDDFVVKLAGGYNEYYNKVEAAVWQALKDTCYEPDLMPVLEYVHADFSQFQSALFMRKATTVNVTSAEIKECESRLSGIGILDGCESNFGRYRNRIRMFDYATVSSKLHKGSPLYSKLDG